MGDRPDRPLWFVATVSCGVCHELALSIASSCEQIESAHCAKCNAVAPKEVRYWIPQPQSPLSPAQTVDLLLAELRNDKGHA